MQRHQTMLKRYIVLNNRAFFIYKDDIAFRAYPMKPAVVIPLPEVVSVSLKSNQVTIKTPNGPRQ